MAIEIKNEQLRYCVDRLNQMECKTDGDLIFLGQCLSAIWDKIHKVQPEIDSAASCNMNIGQALEALKAGKKVARSGWNGAGMFVVYQKGYPQGIPCNKQTAAAWGMNEGDLFICNPYLQIKNVNGSHSMWVPSINDVLADDWMIIE
jgi:hypothetical protein